MSTNHFNYFLSFYDLQGTVQYLLIDMLNFFTVQVVDHAYIQELLIKATVKATPWEIKV